MLAVTHLLVLSPHRLGTRRRLEQHARASVAGHLPFGARVRRGTLRPWVAIPVVLGIATLTSGAWWDPASWVEFVTGIINDELGKALLKMLDLAFNNPLTVISASEWNVAFAQAAKWGGVFAVVAVAMCAIEIVAGIIAQDGGRVIRGWVWAVAAWPLTAASLLVFSKLVNVSDWLSSTILGSISLEQAGTAADAALVSAGATAGATALTSMLLGVSAVGFWPLAILCLVLILLPVLALVIVMGAVTFGQVALAAFGPVALMLVGFKGTRAMAQKWLTMSAALLLTKPIAAGIVALGCALGTSGGLDGMIMGIIAIIMAIGSPAMAFSFVGFAGAQIGGAMTAHADRVKNLTGGATQAATHKGLDMLAGRAKAASEASKLAHEAGQGDGGNAEGAAGTAGSGAGGWHGAASKIRAWARGATAAQGSAAAASSGAGAPSGAPGASGSAQAGGPDGADTGSHGPAAGAEDVPGGVDAAAVGGSHPNGQSRDERFTDESVDDGSHRQGSAPFAGTAASSPSPVTDAAAGASGSAPGSTAGPAASTPGVPSGAAPGQAGGFNAGSPESPTATSAGAGSSATGSTEGSTGSGGGTSVGSTAAAGATSVGSTSITSTNGAGAAGPRPDASAPGWGASPAQPAASSPASEGSAAPPIRQAPPTPPAPEPPAPGQSGPNPFGGAS